MCDENSSVNEFVMPRTHIGTPGKKTAHDAVYAGARTHVIFRVTHACAKSSTGITTSCPLGPNEHVIPKHGMHMHGIPLMAGTGG